MCGLAKSDLYLQTYKVVFQRDQIFKYKVYRKNTREGK